MLLILVILTIFYMILGILLHIGLSRKYDSVQFEPTVSILVAARNEESNIVSCLESLSRLEYPSSKLEVLVLNDRSSDDTAKLAAAFAGKFSFISLIDITEDRWNLRGKMNVLAQGIEFSHGAILMVTDADCIVPETWVRNVVKFFTADTGIVAGMTVIRPGKSWQNLFSMDWMFLVGAASAAAGLGFPVTILGNNFAFRRSSYDEVGGFSKLGFSVTEDFQLMQAIKKLTHWKIVYPLQAFTTVTSNPPAGWLDFYQQRKRWLTGGKSASLFGYVLMGTSFSFRFFLAALLFSGNFSTEIQFAMICLATVDLSLMIRLMKSFGRFGQLVWFIPHQVFMFVYMIVLGLTLFFPVKVKWKDRIY